MNLHEIAVGVVAAATGYGVLAAVAAVEHDKPSVWIKLLLALHETIRRGVSVHSLWVRLGFRHWSLCLRLDRSRWMPLVTACGLKNSAGGYLVRKRVRRVRYGLSVGMHIPHGKHLADVSQQLPEITSGLGLPTGTVTRIVAGTHTDRAELHIVLRNTLRETLPFPAAWRADDIRTPVPLGMNEFHEPDTLQVCGHLAVVGSTGNGKSALLRPICWAAVTAPNAHLTYVDPKIGDGSLWRGLATVATTEDQIRAAVQRVHTTMNDRRAALEARGQVTHVPTVEEPAEILVVDEGAMLRRRGMADVVMMLTGVAQEGRAAHCWLKWASQEATDKDGGLPTGIGSQLDDRISLKMATAEQSRYVFGPGAPELGWRPDLLTGGKGAEGWYMVRDGQHLQPQYRRAYFIPPELVRALPRPAALAAPYEALSLPPVPAYAPAVNAPQTAAHGPVDQAVLDVLEVATAGLSIRQIVAKSGRDKDAVPRALRRLAAAGLVTADDRNPPLWWLAPAHETDLAFTHSPEGNGS